LFADEVNSQRKNQIKITDSTARWVEYNDYTWDQLQKLLPDIENLDFYGGEPFLVKEISKLLSSAIEQGYSQQMRLHFNSNGSVFPDKLIPIFEQFKSVDIALSIDNIGSRFELERGGQWAEVEKNILNFCHLDSTKFTTYIMPTVNIQNVYYLDDLFDWASNHQIRVTVNFLNDPAWANINNLTPTAKQLVIDKFSQSRHKELQLLAVRVSTSAGSSGTEFVHQMKRFDQIRDQDFGITHNEIAQAMGYNLSSSN
jgi:MoaA/NifB/PqqE/SkfB family radical SAM enzyme